MVGSGHQRRQAQRLPPRILTDPRLPGQNVKSLRGLGRGRTLGIPVWHGPGHSGQIQPSWPSQGSSGPSRTLPGPLPGSPDPSRTPSRTPPRTPPRVPRPLQDPSQDPQGPQTPLQDPSQDPQGPPEPLQDPPGTTLGPPLGPPWDHPGTPLASIRAPLDPSDHPQDRIRRPRCARRLLVALDACHRRFVVRMCCPHILSAPPEPYALFFTR